MTISYECLVCGSSDKWKNVDEYRYKPSGMHICEGCGFITYPERLSKSDETLKEFYRNDYRKPPNINNYFTCERKTQYHKKFLSPLFAKWRKEEKNAPVVTEIGAAYGMFLEHVVKAAFPDADVNGTELTKSFRANAWEEFGINLTEDLDETKQYDLIASYKVAEHIPRVDKELRRYAKLLKPDGVLYISVPLWFKYMTNFGVSGFDLEYYYHPNHINVWTKEHFEWCLSKAGLEIVGDNHVYYDSTYLCKRNDKLMDQDHVEWDVKGIWDKLERYKKASDNFNRKEFKEAIEVVPEFPLAWSAHYENNRAQFHKLGYDGIKKEFMEVAMGAMPDDVSVVLLCLDIAMRYSKWDDAMTLVEHGNKMSPNNPGILKGLSHIFRQLALESEKTGDYDKSIKMMTQARDTGRLLLGISAQSRDEQVSWIYGDNARIWEMKEKSGQWKGDNFNGL